MAHEIHFCRRYYLPQGNTNPLSADKPCYNNIYKIGFECTHKIFVVKDEMLIAAKILLQLPLPGLVSNQNTKNKKGN